MMAKSESTTPSGKRTAVVVLAILAVTVVVFTAVSAGAGAAYKRTFDSGRTLERRVADAQTARCLTPWSKSHRSREYVMVMWLGGRQLLDAGDYSGSVNVLSQAYRKDVGEKELLALFQRAQEIEAMATTRKAHLQHGHEGPGSSLRPQDVER
jgi:hypothetical protein